jgi:D-sedoheptulose 7-phosphate isomerase
MLAAQKQIEKSIQEGVLAVQYLLQKECMIFIENLAQQIAACLQKGGKLLIAGNGGSLCDAMHFAEELSGLYRNKRPALAALALADPGHMSCVGNDLGYQFVFSRAIEALGREGDMFIGLTTSGNSSNILEAVRAAKAKVMQTASFLGKTGGALKGMCDLELIVPGFGYSDRIQEAHMTAIHIVIERVETLLFAPAHVDASQMASV